MDCSCQHIDPLIHTFISNYLCPQPSIGSFLKYDFHCHDFSARIISRMAHRRQNHLIHIKPCFSCIFLINTGCRCCHVKHFDYRASLWPQISAVTTTYIIRCDSTLFICRTCQRDQRILSCHVMLHLNCIAYRINIRFWSFHTVIHQNTSFDSKLQSCFFCETAIWCNADC